MKRVGRQAFISAVAVCVAVLVGSGLAKKSDNTYTFGYDADTNTISYAASSQGPFRRNGPKTTLVAYVRENKGSEEFPLKGLVIYSSHTGRRARYAGTVKLMIRAADGTPYSWSEDVAWTLSGKKNDSRKLEFEFDLPSGDYTATASFRTSAG